jgi:hypothetical protein
MKRLGIVAVVSLALMTVLSSTSFAARPSASLVGHASAAVPGGTLHVSATVKHAGKATLGAATAVIHFGGTDPSGDVTVTLRRVGRSYVVKGRVPVPETQPIGRVLVDFSVMLGATELKATARARIVPQVPADNP